MNTALLFLALAVVPEIDMIGRGPVPSMDQLDMIGHPAPKVAPLAAPSIPVVDFYAPSWCSACGPKVAAMMQVPGIELRIHRNSRDFPAWTQGVGAYPIAAWTHDGQSHYHYASFDSVEAWRRSWEATKPRADVGQSPTPIAEVRRVLALLRPQPHETFVDYGCGDGRWLIEAARTYRCRAVGVEIDPQQVDLARRAVDDAGLVGRVQIIEGDVLTANVEAHVGVAYLWQETLDALASKLQTCDRFASIQHRVTGLPMVQYGDAFIWRKPQSGRSAQSPSSTPARSQRGVSWGGMTYYGPVCNSRSCAMCNGIRRMLGQQ